MAATSTIGWRRVRLPPVERIVLTDMALRRGQSDEDTLAAIVREAARRECVERREPAPREVAPDGRDE